MFRYIFCVTNLLNYFIKSAKDFYVPQNSRWHPHQEKFRPLDKCILKVNQAPVHSSTLNSVVIVGVKTIAMLQWCLVVSRLCFQQSFSNHDLDFRCESSFQFDFTQLSCLVKSNIIIVDLYEYFVVILNQFQSQDTILKNPNKP